MTITAPQPVETSTQSPLGAAVPITRHPFQPSPLNRGRWQNFKANRRGYWSFWIFLVLFTISLFANFIANDKPLLVKYDGRLYWPVLFSYSETTFGGDFETTADYRDPYLQKQIAEKGGTMIWPPIRYSYDTHNLDLPTPAPSKPTWMLTEEQCKEVVQKKGLKSCRDLEYNWLGTDDQSRDVVARLIYGFRISVLFGLTLTILSSIIGIAAGGVQGYFGGWIDLSFQRFHRSLDRDPSLYLLLIISAVLPPGFFILLGILLLFSWVSLVGLVRAEFLRGRNFEYIQAARALGVSKRRDHVPSPAAERDGGDDDVPALHRVVLGDDADGAGLPRLRPAARLAVARRIAVAGQGQRAGAMARLHRLLLGRDHAVALIFIGEAARDAFDPRKTFR
jgi:microcin C transport system permease protein